jgi:hypothetical protein
LTAADVDDEIGLESAGDLSDAIGAGRMVAPGHDNLAAEALDASHDAGIVGRDNDFARSLRLAGPFVNVLDEILAGRFKEWLAGQSARGIAGGNDDGAAH